MNPAVIPEAAAGISTSLSAMFAKSCVPGQHDVKH